MRYIGINLDNELVEKIKIISFITKKNRTQLIIEGLNYIIDKYGENSFESFQEQIKKLKNK